MAFRTNREYFDCLVERALETITKRYFKYFKNIKIIVEDYPTREDVRELNVNKTSLLGLFRGAPYPIKNGFFDIPSPMPDAIVLFQKNIESICSSEKELIREIRKTLVHEVGHYFGLSEEDLRKYE